MRIKRFPILLLFVMTAILSLLYVASVAATPGCCVNPNTLACEYTDNVTDCCPNGEYNNLNGPRSQEGCMENWFSPYNGTEACSVMGPPLDRYCMLGCCCEQTPEGLSARETKQLLCNGTWGTFDELNCSPESCDAFLLGKGIKPKASITFTRITNEVCVGEKFVFCPSDSGATEAEGLPGNAKMKDGCMEYTPYGEGEFTITFKNPLDIEYSELLTLHVVVCDNPLKIELIPPQKVIAGNRLSFTLRASGEGTLKYSVQNLPENAVFNPKTLVFSWTPTNEDVGEHNVVFSVSNSEGITDEIAVEIVVIKSKDFLGAGVMIGVAAVLTLLGFATGVIPALLAALPGGLGLLIMAFVITGLSMLVAWLATSL